MKFSELDLKPEVLQSLDEMGYVDMTPIQEQAIPHILQGRDLVGLAETGSGKTSACGVPLVHLTDSDSKAIQHLVLVPTRELALQYVQELDRVGSKTEVVPFAVFGGFDMDIQKAKLAHKVNILVATPGRLIDFIWNTKLDLTQVQTVVLDEADEMLNMGFLEDVDFILSCLLQEHRTLLFSATMPTEITRLSNKYLTDPVRIELNSGQRAPSSLEHHFLYERDRLTALTDYLKEDAVRQAIVFCNTRDRGSTLHKELGRSLSSAEFIHGGLDQDRRTSIFNRFRNKKIKYLVATDLAGRGLDFSHVSHVVNSDFPFNSEIYTHRTGRAGRMGRAGTALTLVTDRDLRTLDTILQRNEIKPVWVGAPPDPAKVGRGPAGGGGSKSGGKGGGGGGRRRSGGGQGQGGNSGTGGSGRSGSSRRRGSNQSKPANNGGASQTPS